MTQEQLISNLKAMADKDGVVSLKKDSNERYYLEKIVGKNDGLLMNEWIKKNIGLVMYVKGKNDGEVILHRLRQNGLLHSNKTKNAVRETLFASDLIVDENDKTVLSILKTRLRSQIKEQAYVKRMSAEEYVKQYLGIDYIPKGKVSIKSFDDVDKWINNNIKDDNADTLKSCVGFVNVREWLRQNWKIQNKDVVSAFADYVICNYPEYHLTAHVQVKDKTQLFREQLLRHYPNKVVYNLKLDHEKLYNLIYSYRREVPKGHIMSMKEMIENFIGQGEIKYLTATTTRRSKYTLETIRAGLENAFGKGDLNNLTVMKMCDNNKVNNQKRRILDATRAFCKGNEISLSDFLAGEGYVQVSKISKGKVPAKRHKLSNNLATKYLNNARTLRLSFGPNSKSDGKSR